MNSPANQLQELAKRYSLSTDAVDKFELLADLCVSLEISGTSVKTADEALNLHIADSLVGLTVDAVDEAETLVDVGTGVGFPGIVLAVARPELSVTLIDSVRKKVEATAQICRELGLTNTECIWSRVEEFCAPGAPSRESFDVFTARALAALPVLVEYAGPLLRQGGTLVAWKGLPSQEELADAAKAEAELGFARGSLIAVSPFAASHRRHLYIAHKCQATSERYPRRPGVALRRPIVESSQ